MSDAEREFWELAEWDWVHLPWGRLLHAVREAIVGDWAGVADGVTACGRPGLLAIPGIFTRMGAMRCADCCTALGYPQGKGSPKNDNACRPLVEARVAELAQRLNLARVDAEMYA